MGIGISIFPSWVQASWHSTIPAVTNEHYTWHGKFYFKVAKLICFEKQKFTSTESRKCNDACWKTVFDPTTLSCPSNIRKASNHRELLREIGDVDSTDGQKEMAPFHGLWGPSSSELSSALKMSQPIGMYFQFDCPLLYGQVPLCW